MTGVVATITQRSIGILEHHTFTVAIIGTGITVYNVTGGGGEGGTVDKLAAQALGGHRVVVNQGAVLVDYADKDTVGDLPLVLGVTNGAASQGALVVVTLYGQMSDVSWGWTPGQYVYLGSNGLLTQTVPTTGFLLIIGTALAPTVLNVKFGVPIKLS